MSLRKNQEKTRENAKEFIDGNSLTHEYDAHVCKYKHNTIETKRKKS